MADTCKCKHYPALSHDRWGCKLCDCDLDDQGRQINRVGAKQTKGRAKKRFRYPLYVRIGIDLALVVIVLASASASILPNFVGQNQSQDAKYYEALQSIFYLIIILGIAGIVYTELGNHFSGRELKEWIAEIEKRLDDAGIPKSDPPS